MNVREKKTHQYLEKLGFLVHTVTKPSTTFWKDLEGKITSVRKGLDHDLFGLWDHVAVLQCDGDYTKQETWDLAEKITKLLGWNCIPLIPPNGQTIWVQTKSRKQYGKELEKYKDFPGFKLLFVWTKKPNGRWDEPEITVL